MSKEERRLPGPEPEALAAVRIANWLRRTAAAADLTYEEWARKADVSGTTITRFLGHGKPVPKATTLAKLAIAAGLPPPDIGVETIPGLVDIPLILPRVARIRGVEFAMSEAVETTRVPSRYAHCAAAKATADTASLAGVLVGDLVVFDPKREPKDGDLVLVEFEDGTAGCLQVSGGWLMPRAIGMTKPTPREQAFVLGVAVQIQRDLG